MHYFMLIFFSVVGAAGLIYNNEIGVFVGLGLIPWQIIGLRKSKTLNLIAIIITTVIGVGFFIYMGKWILAILFLFIEAYNYWGHMNTELKKEK